MVVVAGRTEWRCVYSYKLQSTGPLSQKQSPSYKETIAPLAEFYLNVDLNGILQLALLCANHMMVIMISNCSRHVVLCLWYTDHLSISLQRVSSLTQTLLSLLAALVNSVSIATDYNTFPNDNNYIFLYSY